MPLKPAQSLINSAMARAQAMTLRERLLVAPLLALLLVGALIAGHQWGDARQIALMEKVIAEETGPYDRYAEASMKLTVEHTALRNLTQNLASKDERELRDLTKSRLDRVQIAADELLALLPASRGGASSTESIQLAKAARAYRRAAMQAADAVSNDPKRLPEKLTTADEGFLAVVEAFDLFLDAQRDALVSEIRSDVSSAQALGRWMAIAGIGTGLSLLVLAWFLARLLSGSLNRQISLLLEVGASASTEPQQKTGSEIDRMSSAVLLFRATLQALRLREVDLQQARETLEQRVEDRTQALSVANASLLQEIDLRSSAEQRLTVFAEVVASTSDGIVIATPDMRVIDANPAFEAICGIKKEQLIGTSLLANAAQPSGSKPEASWSQLVRASGHWGGELIIRRSDGLDVPCLVSINRVSQTGDGAQHVVGICHNIAELRRQQEQLQHQATHDALTSLPNRVLLLDRLAVSINHCDRNDGSLALMFIDLDKFKDINDTLGHGAGDELLIGTADRLSACVRDCDTVARLGGDEFVVLVDGIEDETAVSRLAQRITETLALPFALLGNDHSVTCSLGISMYPEDGRNSEELMKAADIAMYRAKESGRNNFQFYKGDMQIRLGERMTLERQLRKALERDEFILHYQPQIDLRSGRIVGLEALVRWQSPEFGLVPPARFIPLAEESGLISSIGEWVLSTVCRSIARWKDQGVQVVPVAVNVAASQFAHQRFDQLVQMALRSAGIEPRLLELELTESLSMADPETSIPLMHRLKEIGVSLSIDDFGTGYSNLAYLKRFPVDTLKIDQSFVRGMVSNAEEQAIAAAVIGLAHALRIRALAEGVETESQLKLLASMGCDAIQGYYFARPLPEAQVLELLNKGESLDLNKLDRAPYRRTILFVDDDASMRTLVQEALAGEDLHLLCAPNTEQAYELLAGNEVGVVISDYQMPKENGIEFLSRIRGLYPQTARILLTGDSSSEVFETAINRGEIFRFLPKPWRKNQLREALSAAFQRYEQPGDTLARRS